VIKQIKNIMVEELGLEKSKVDEIYYAILHPNLISNSYKWKTVVNQLFMARCLSTSSRVVNKSSYVGCQWGTCGTWMTYMCITGSHRHPISTSNITLYGTKSSSVSPLSPYCRARVRLQNRWTKWIPDLRDSAFR